MAEEPHEDDCNEYGLVVPIEAHELAVESINATLSLLGDIAPEHGGMAPAQALYSAMATFAVRNYGSKYESVLRDLFDSALDIAKQEYEDGLCDECGEAMAEAENNTKQ